MKVKEAIGRRTLFSELEIAGSDSSIICTELPEYQEVILQNVGPKEVLDLVSVLIRKTADDLDQPLDGVLDTVWQKTTAEQLSWLEKNDAQKYQNFDGGCY